MNLYLREEFQDAWGSDPFAEVEKLSGEVFRQVKGRTTLRFEFNNKSYFLKRHEGVGWQEIIKNLVSLRLPILGAREEYQAINRLHELGIDTMTVAAFGERGFNPATRQSFLVTDDLVDTVSLEDFCIDWKKQPPPFNLKYLLIRKVAEISGRMHGNGLNHRDYYICHFHLNTARLDAKPRLTLDDIVLHLIDLHRMQIRDKTPQRWVVKDIGGLYFSAMELGLHKRDIYRFIKGYTGKNLKQAINDHRDFWMKVQSRAVKMYKSFYNKAPELAVKID